MIPYWQLLVHAATHLEVYMKIIFHRWIKTRAEINNKVSLFWPLEKKMLICQKTNCFFESKCVSKYFWNTSLLIMNETTSVGCCFRMKRPKEIKYVANMSKTEKLLQVAKRLFRASPHKCGQCSNVANVLSFSSRLEDLRRRVQLLHKRNGRKFSFSKQSGFREEHGREMHPCEKPIRRATRAV